MYDVEKLVKHLHSCMANIQNYCKPYKQNQAKYNTYTKHCGTNNKCNSVTAKFWDESNVDNCTSQRFRGFPKMQFDKEF